MKSMAGVTALLMPTWRSNWPSSGRLRLRGSRRRRRIRRLFGRWELIFRHRRSSTRTGSPVRIPGAFGGRGTTFGAYYSEFYADDPFTQTEQDSVPINDRGRTLPISSFEGFAPPDMKVEWVDIKVVIEDGSAADINELRLALRSPDGTISELNQFIRSPTRHRPSIFSMKDCS